MSIRSVAHWLNSEQRFREQLDQLTIASVARQFPFTVDGESPSPSEFHPNWQYMLVCASLLAESNTGDHQDAALRIAHACLESNGADSNHNDAAAMVLDKLSNRVAINLAEARYLLQPELSGRLPTPLRIEWTHNYFDHAVLSNGSLLPVNRFQKKLWIALSESKKVSASAPTATGKSYILINWIGAQLDEAVIANIVYLVPTRALISEIERKIKEFFRAKNLDANVTSVPSLDSLQVKATNILIFTQERLQILLMERPELKIDILVVDEAHKFGDGQRGVLLQQVVEQVEAANSDVRVIYASPLAENPGVLLADYDASAPVRAVASEDITVNQNLIWVSQLPRRPRNWQASLMLDGNQKYLGNVELPATPSSDSKRLPYVAYALAKNTPGNVVYANGAAAAEKAADKLYRLLDDVDERSIWELNELIDLVERTIHRKYSLALVLRRGVAFHYGNMPLLIKTEIERLFTKNVIRYLVCTSTLVEGVNMACKSIFLRGPQKGQNRPMSREDFWNLAGRAGRWGHDFQGNVVCVDATVERLWADKQAPKKRGTYPIKRTADEILLRPADLIEFLSAGTPRDAARKRPDLEYVSSYLVAQHLRLGGIRNAPWASRMDPKVIGEVANIVSSIAERLTMPSEVVFRNPGVSPLAMEGLLTYFRGRGGDIEELLPVQPASADAVDAYTRVFARAFRHLGSPLGPSGRSYMLAILVTDWMRGYPLSRLIESRIRYHKRRSPGKLISSTIRSVMEDVEKIARFEAPKALTAYSDVLRLFLVESGRQELMGLIPDVNILLEFGVSQKTQISLMSLGLSRTSAIELSEIVVDDSMSKTEALDWLRQGEWREVEMPAVIVREIEETLNPGSAHAK